VAVVVVEFLDQVGGREDDDDGRGLVLLVAGDGDGLRLDVARSAEVAGSALDDGGHIDRTVGAQGRVTELASHLDDDSHPVVRVGQLEADPATVGVVRLSTQPNHGGHEQSRLPAAGTGGVETTCELVELNAELSGRVGHLLAEVDLREGAFDRERCDSGGGGHSNSGCSSWTMVRNTYGLRGSCMTIIFISTQLSRKTDLYTNRILKSATEVGFKYFVIINPQCQQK
jgi:hypothetical protein